MPMKILVTAGPTREPVDPVRYLSNRSSGKMGYAVAASAARRGHEVVLVSGPVALEAPDGVRRVSVTTAAEMCRAVEEQLADCEALVMAAAVADFRPAECSAQKIKKGAQALLLRLEPTEDILKKILPRKGARVFVGFAAETGRLLEEAARKREEKGLDLIVANDVSRADSGFEVDTNQVFFLSRDGTRTEWPLLAKSDVAEKIVEWIERHR